MTPAPIPFRPRSLLAPPSWVQVRTVFGSRPILRYAQLPQDYEDDVGLSFQKRALTQREANKIFGSGIEAASADRLLKIIHGRRVAGTLEDPTLQHNTAQYTPKAKMRALEYLREHIPVDEVINAGLRAEDELRELEQGEQEQAGEREPEQEPVQKRGRRRLASDMEEKTGKGEHSPPGKLLQQVEALKPRSKSWRDVYGESNFDRIRAENLAKQEAEDRLREEERKPREEQESLQNIGTLQTDPAKPRELSPRMKDWAERATSDLAEPPEMKSWERLLPSLVMTVLVCAGCALFAASYTPPRKSWRVWPDVPPAAATMTALISLNLVVWMAWKAPPLWRLLNRYFLVAAATPRPLQLVGAMFSHQTSGHLLMNMAGLWFFGTRVHDELGRGNFLALFTASGVVGFMCSLSSLVLWRGLEFTTLGASSAVYGVIAGYLWMHRYDEFKVFGYPPDPMSGPQGLAFLGLLLGSHVALIFSKKRTRVDLASHMGGIVAGAVGVDFIKERMVRQAQRRAERMKMMGISDKVVVNMPPRSGSPPPA